MERTQPVLFEFYPNLKDKVPWIPLLTSVPTPVNRLTELEKHLNISSGQIYIKRDDKNHHIYGGNKLRKFEFIFGNAKKKKKKGVLTFGGVGTNHGLACAIIAKQLDLKCDLFLANQPLTWHIQRSLLLFDYFGAKLHYASKYGSLALKGLLFRIFHPKYFLMLPGGSILMGHGSPLGTVGFINAFLELKKQINNKILSQPDIIFVAGGSTGTAAGLIAGIKLMNLKIKVHVVAVSDEMFVNPKSIMVNSNKTLKYLQDLDNTIPNVKVVPEDFKVVTGYLGSEYGIKTIRGQNAVDLVMKLEGKKNNFKLETTYTGKTMAAMLDFLEKKENKSKKVLFWNTYNSNDLNKYLKETNFNYLKLPQKFHQFYQKKQFQCWQLKNCPEENKNKCESYLNEEYRCWLVKNCPIDKQKNCIIFDKLKKVIKLENA
ncbi:MAG: 1-aminocyclopropane-1-carboxylate deaminase/D-cysteine desulfhydrase [Promethearchaeota archaeon]